MSDQTQTSVRVLDAAERTLIRIGYTWRGGELYAPPIGARPDFDLNDKLRSALQDAITQIEYLHEKFKETESGNVVLAHCRAVLA